MSRFCPRVEHAVVLILSDEQLQFCVIHSLRLTLVWKVLARRCPNKQYSPRFLFGEGSGNDNPDLFLIGNDSPTKYKYKYKHWNRQDAPNNRLDWCFCSQGDVEQWLAVRKEMLTVGRQCASSNCHGKLSNCVDIAWYSMLYHGPVFTDTIEVILNDWHDALA